ncbi:Spherulation-specific family 4 [Crucibulum laeve]|uniref:Spherulation-specific family 4 n=1 Tax=Crucibulum laeve TaxID=68775 RepID=A0A5C3M0V5_9AGAR|nr:Spherulation-specific family 4 [Crucibulum laeve]
MFYTMAMRLTIALILFFPETLALLSSGAIFPLYIYPGDDCSAWTTVIGSIQACSTVPFYIVVNPASGPGASGTQPDTNYQACIARLRTTASAHGNNLKILGYVATGFGSRASTAVTADIDTYNQWATSYRPDGIFFDEVATATSFLPTYQAYSTKVHQDFGTSFIILNPGTTPQTSGYFNIADFIVTFEGFYNDFSQSALTISADRPAHKQVVILHDGPAQISFTLVDQLAEIIGVGASFITNFPNAVAYENVPGQWLTFCGDLISAQTA